VKPTIYNCRLIYVYWDPKQEICYCGKRQYVGNCINCKDYALQNYAPVLQARDKLEDKYPTGKGEDYPVGWTDPLDLYGVYQCELIELGFDLNKERTDLQGLIDKKGPEYVWRHRQRLVAERIFIKNFRKK
jgi:hypothetical protein